MGGVSRETCWASYEYGIINFDTLLNLVGYFCMNFTMIHGSMNIKLTLILLTCRIWWTPNNASRWQMGFNSAFKGLKWILTFYNLLVTWCTTSLTFNNCTLCPHCIYVFCIYLRTNDLCHLQHKLIGFYNRDVKCLLHGTNWVFNFIKPTCYVMHQQFNIQQLYALPTLYLCVLYLSRREQRFLPYIIWTGWFL